MKLVTLTIGVTLVSAVISARGLWSFYRSLAPIPQQLHSFSGTASGVQVSTANFSRAHASFTLQQPDGQLPRFSYLPMFTGFHDFAGRLRNGAPIEVTIGPQGVEDLWGLKLGPDVLMTAEQAYESRRADGYWSLALGLGFLAATLWNVRDVRQLRHQDGGA